MKFFNVMLICTSGLILASCDRPASPVALDEDGYPVAIGRYNLRTVEGHLVKFDSSTGDTWMFKPEQNKWIILGDDKATFESIVKAALANTNSPAK